MSGDAGAPEPREVEVGLHNSTWVEVVEGLSGGETVLLSPPEGFEVEYVLGDEAEEESSGESGLPKDSGGSEGGGEWEGTQASASSTAGSQWSGGAAGGGTE